MDVSKVPDIHPDRQPPRNAPKRRRPAPVKLPEPDEKPSAPPAPEAEGHIDVTV